MRFIVIDSPFNREVCPHLIGQTYGNPPSYVEVRPLAD